MRKCQRKSQHGTQNVKTQNMKTQKTKRMSNTDPTNKLGVNPDAFEGKSVPASYKTPAVLLIYTVKSGILEQILCLSCFIWLTRRESIYPSRVHGFKFTTGFVFGGFRVSHLLSFCMLCCVFRFVCLSSDSCVPNVADASGLSLWNVSSISPTFQYDGSCKM